MLLNAYKPGQGIMAHRDGPLYHLGVCIVSLGAPTVLHFTRKSPHGGKEDFPSQRHLLMHALAQLLSSCGLPAETGMLAVRSAAQSSNVCAHPGAMQANCFLAECTPVMHLTCRHYLVFANIQVS